MHTRTAAALSLACLSLASVQPCNAAQADEWQYEATFYLHAAGMEGDVGARGVTAEMDASFSDIWDHLDAGFMGMMTARKGRWSFLLDLVYMKLEDSSSGSLSGPFGSLTIDGALDLETSLYVAMVAAGYRVLDDKTKVDLHGGLRYTKLEVDATIKVSTPGVVFPGGSKSADGSEDWVDGVIGVSVQHPVADNVSLTGYADIGAGGSDLTYQAIAGVNWEFKKDYTVKAGYRLMYWDYENDGIVWDMTASGPYLGLGIAF